MPVSKKGVAYRQRRAFFVRVAVFCAWGVYNLTSRRAMRSVCWLAALALAATDADVLFPSFCACPWLRVRFGSSAGSSLQTPPSVPVGTTSVVAGSCLLRSRLARFVLPMMYDPAVRSPLPVAPGAHWLLRRQQAVNSSVRACRHNLRRLQPAACSVVASLFLCSE